MKTMRIFLTSAVLAAAATPAAAQIFGPADPMLRMQQEDAQRRAIDQANQLEAMSARMRADQATLELRLQRGEVGPPQVPALRFGSPAGPSAPASATFPSIPDAALADSNRRVQQAAGNRR